MLVYSETNFNTANNGGNCIIESSLNECHHKVNNSPISLKVVTNGKENYSINNKEYFLSPNYFLLVNDGDKVETLVDSNKKVDGKCIYFDSKMINKYFLEIKYNSLFNDHNLSTGINFNSGRFWLDNSDLSQLLLKIRNNQLNDKDDMFYDNLAVSLVKYHIGLRNVLDNLNIINYTTKIELYNRVANAKSYILDNYTEDISLDDLSAISCVSKYHLLRVFKNIFGTTPYKMILEKRLDKARVLLKSSNYSIEDASFTCGFRQRRTFTRAYKNRFGICPIDEVSRS